jgi:hypothetical protein
MADGNSSPASNARGVDHAADHGAVNNTPPAPDAMSDAVPNQFPPLPQPVEMRQLALTFNGSAGESVTFKIKNTMKLRKAMEAYSARVQRPVDQLRFLFDGQRLRNEDTPIEVSLQFPLLSHWDAPHIGVRELLPAASRNFRITETPTDTL